MRRRVCLSHGIAVAFLAITLGGCEADPRVTDVAVADAYSTRAPAPYRAADGSYRMVYVGMGDDLRYRLLAARAMACDASL